MAGRTFKLPQLVECADIPQDKREIVTAEMARQFPHLKETAEEIPPYDPRARIEILIGRDAPELLKIRASKNGPKGGPWAQQVDLGWIVSGQMCLDRVGGPVHISAHRTAVEYSNKHLGLPWSTQAALHSPTQHEVTPCPNHFKVKEKYAEKGEIGADYTRQQYGEHVARGQALPGDYGNGDPQKQAWKLGNATSLPFFKHCDA